VITEAPATLIRVVIADDSAGLRLLLRSTLLGDGGFEVVGEAGDGAEAVRVVVCERPDIVLLDLAMPIMDGMETIPVISRLAPETRIAVLSSFDAAHSERQALKCGADVYMSKSASGEEVVTALRRLCPDLGGRRPVTTTRPATGAVETLLQAEDRYQTIVQEVTDYGIFMLDKRGNVESWNIGAERMTGYSSDEIIGRPFASFYSPADALAGKPERALARAATGGRFEGDERSVRRDGSKFWAHVVLNALRDAEGRTRGFAVVTQDVTGRVTALRELHEKTDHLERSNNELEQFARVASHDLQEPLRTVASYVQLLKKRYAGKLGEDADDYIEFAVDGATRMQTLIADLLAFSRAARAVPELTLVDVSESIAAARSNLEAALTESGGDIVWGEMPRIQADASQLVQLFQNLIGNAIKFHGDEPPHVEISAARQAAGWLFSVCDRGIGIEAAHAERVFEVFQRLHTREEYPGTGVGLALCRKVVERLGGTIWVESESGQGSSFLFTVPDVVEGKSWS